MAREMLFVLRRFVGMATTLFAVAVLVFAITQLLPGDVATMMLGMSATEEDLVTLRVQMGLDQPAWLQFIRWFGGLLHADLGVSQRYHKPVLEVLREPVARSAMLGGIGALVSIPLGLVLGAYCGARRGGAADRILSGGALFAAAMPEFVTGGVLIVVLSSWLGLLPAFAGAQADAGFGRRAAELVMPVTCLSLVLIAYILRMMRASVSTTLASEFVRAARLKGLSRRRIFVHHVLPISLGPTLQVIALSVGWLASGLVIVENLFGIPGIGRLLVFAIQNRDVALVQAITLLVALCFSLSSFCADAIHRAVDPRVAA